MRKFKFKITAYTEIYVVAEDLNKARKQADIEWFKFFENGMHGEVEFIKEEMKRLPRLTRPLTNSIQDQELLARFLKSEEGCD